MPSETTPFEVDCPQCKKKFSIEDIPEPQIQNCLRLVIVYWVFDKLPRCPNCLQLFHPQLAGLGVRTSWVATPFQEDVKERQKVIIPPTAH